MYTGKIFVLLILLSGSAYSGFDSLFVNISGDVATVWHKNTMSNCASKFEFEVKIGSDTISIIERDTVGPLVHCTCMFDLNVQLINIGGTHTVAVYRQQLKKYFYQKDTMYLIGTTSLIMPGANQLPYYATNGFQSKCGGIPVGVKKQTGSVRGIELFTNYPNPFNPSTTISFYLPSKQFVLLKIFDCLGREVAILVNDERSAGYHSVPWNASSVSSGVYMFQLQAGKYVESKRLTVIR